MLLPPELQYSKDFYRYLKTDSSTALEITLYTADPGKNSNGQEQWVLYKPSHLILLFHSYSPSNSQLRLQECLRFRKQFGDLFTTLHCILG